MATFRLPFLRALVALAVLFGVWTLAARPALAQATPDYQDLWWGGPQEAGWGLTITQHGEVLFVALFVYDRFGKPVWTVMPGGRWNATHTEIEGDVYTPTSAPFFAYDASRFFAGAPAGTLRLRFASTQQGTLELRVLGETTTKTIVRQVFGQGPARGNFTDLWWGGPAQNGWGLGITQQGTKIFAVWFTYDESGTPIWYVMPDGVADAAGTTYAGRLYVTRGPQWFGIPFDGGRVSVTDVGSMSLAFTSASTAVMRYTVGAVTQAKAIERQPF